MSKEGQNWEWILCTDCGVSNTSSLAIGSLTCTTIMSDVEGLRLLANHLAKVKLEAAENRYELSRLLKITQGKKRRVRGWSLPFKTVMPRKHITLASSRAWWLESVGRGGTERSFKVGTGKRKISDRDFFATAASHLVRPCPRSTWKLGLRIAFESNYDQSYPTRGRLRLWQ